MMSGRASLTDAVRATKLGAFQFLEKPLTPEGVLTTLRAALELARTLAENRRLHEALGHSDPLVGVSKRSEEHTSELQSRLHLVCRLLLEKKKKYKTQPNNTQELARAHIVCTTN